MRINRPLLAAVGLILVAACQAPAPKPVSAAQDLPGRIDAAVAEELTRTGEPGASIAVIQDGKLIYAKAYGLARLETKMPAQASQRFAIGSVTKQFTAAAVLMLAEEGKLSLDDKVERWVPGISGGDRITIRQLLSHTAGIRDYWPQDYVVDTMRRPTTPQAIVDRWAKAPLDFQPGEDWQYSNTGFTIAGLIVEKASGVSLNAFLHERVFEPLGMTSVIEIDPNPLPASDPAGYTRYGLGPDRPAPKEGANWLWAMGHLAMTAQDLAKWDTAMMDQRLLRPESWRLMQTAVTLNNGRNAGYGLGLTSASDGGLRKVSHGGEVSGFLAENDVWPDRRQAIVVFVNSDRGDPGAIEERIAKLLPLTTAPSPAQTAAAKGFLEGLQAGRVDRARLTPNASAFFSDEVSKDYVDSLKALGPLQSVSPMRLRMRGGFTQEIYQAKFAKRTVTLIVRADGARYEQFQINP